MPPLYQFEPRAIREARAAGNKAELAVYPGGIHVFNFFSIALADKANSRIHNFIVQAVTSGI